MASQKRVPSLLPLPKKSQATWKTWLILGGLALMATLFILRLWMNTRMVPTFDGQKAFLHLEKQVRFGPRIPGTPGHQKALAYFQQTLAPWTEAVSLQPFEWRDRKDTNNVWQGTNVVASFNLKATRRILLLAHWDTRPFADQDPNPANRTKPVMGANDGASGVAVLLELARILHDYPPKMGVDILLTDMEDLGDYDHDEKPNERNPFSIGAQKFVDMNPDYSPEYGVLLDMVGDKNLRIPYEKFSITNAPTVVENVYAAAERAKAKAFVREEGQAVMDDHVPFLRKGIPVINLIDFEYPYWHTIGDTPDKCSPESLRQVGQTILELLFG